MIVQLYPFITDPTLGTPVPVGSLTVNNRGTLTSATLYTDGTGDTVAANPTSIVNGVINVWALEGSYDMTATVQGQNSAIFPYEAINTNDILNRMGAVILSGDGAPSNVLGSNGDYYLQLDFPYYYGPKASGVWPAAISLVAGEVARAEAAEAAIAASVTALGTGPFGQALAPTAVQTSNFTAAAGTLIPVNLIGASITGTLPTAPLDQTRIAVKVVASTVGNTCVLTCGGADKMNIAGGSSTLTLSANFQGAILQYAHTPGIWYVTALESPLNVALGAARLGTDGGVGGPSGSPISAAIPIGNSVMSRTLSGAQGTSVAVGGDAFIDTLSANSTYSKPIGAVVGTECHVDFEIIQGSTAYTITFWSGINWAGNTPPVMPTTAAQTIFVSVVTLDGGTTWNGWYEGIGGASYLTASNAGVVNGTATLNSLGQLTASQIPTTVVNVTYGTAAPTTGTWPLGAIVLNTTLTAGSPVGWTCTLAGTPGTWKVWGGYIGGTPTGTTGIKTATLGTNGPMVTTTPYTWLQMTSTDGSTVFVPAWK